MIRSSDPVVGAVPSTNSDLLLGLFFFCKVDRSLILGVTKLCPYYVIIWMLPYQSFQAEISIIKAKLYYVRRTEISCFSINFVVSSYKFSSKFRRKKRGVFYGSSGIYQQ